MEDQHGDLAGALPLHVARKHGNATGSFPKKAAFDVSIQKPWAGAGNELPLLVWHIATASGRASSHSMHMPELERKNASKHWLHDADPAEDVKPRPTASQRLQLVEALVGAYLPISHAKQIEVPS